jgi:outer membrane protein assembly factor BamB
VELVGRTSKELLGYRLADGVLQWRRKVPAGATLTASSGGAFYLAENRAAEKGEEQIVLQGLDGETGTLLWTTTMPGHNVPFLMSWGSDEPVAGNFQGPTWRIGRDGAIYGVSIQGAYKLQ